MSMIETVNDVNNSFLSRREITCNFKGLGGKLKKSEAVQMITKELKLDGKTVIAINLKNDAEDQIFLERSIFTMMKIWLKNRLVQ